MGEVATVLSKVRVWSLVLCAFCVGCSTKPQANYSQLGLVNATGTITLDGSPLDGAVVSFDDATDGTFSYGLTNSSGVYRLQLDSVASGVKPGTKVVRISTARKIIGLNTTEAGADAEEKPEPQAERVPVKFNKKSTLFVEVTPGQAKYDFDLKSE